MKIYYKLHSKARARWLDGRSDYTASEYRKYFVKNYGDDLESVWTEDKGTREDFYP